MHELSLAYEVISLTTREAEKHGVTSVREIHLVVGALSGVEADAFESALELCSPGTILEHAVIRLERIPGRGFCTNCMKEFEMQQRASLCPTCGNLPPVIRGGDEFRVVSILPEEQT